MLKSSPVLPRLVRYLTAGLAVASLAVPALLPTAARAAGQLVSVTSFGPGKQPFINLVVLHMNDTNQLDHVQFTVTPKPGSITHPISAQYSNAYLTRRGFLNASTGGFTVPVFGLYAGYENSVTLVFTFVDGTTQINNLLLTSPSYVSGIYTQPAQVVQARTADTTLSYDYMMLKSAINQHTPTIIDTEGNIRWVGCGDTSCTEVLFYKNGFYTVDSKSASPTALKEGGSGSAIQRNEFDGAVTPIKDFTGDQDILTFHHNFDYGKTGILAGISTLQYIEDTIVEVDTAGNILHTWDMGKIISAAMTAGGDDPTKFVAASGSLVDWFHNNCSTYRASNDEIVISSRENFVIALDYESGAIKWILGDPTKQWHQFPSLAKYALTLPAGQHYPIGQHGLSFYHDNLLLFDDGYASADHTPAGKNRTYSAPRKFAIDEASGTATELWHYLNDPAIYSPITSSVYEDRPGSYLIDYATAGPYLFAELIGLNPVGEKVFDYKYTEVNKALTSWNTVPIHLENLVFE